MITDKFQDAFNSMKSDGIVKLNLDLHEVSTILSLLKSHDAYIKSLNENMDITCSKLESEYKQENTN